MKIYDITQEVFTSEVFPGDPAPERREVARISRGDRCNLTAFSMCAHNGTHIDAPCHFIEGGASVSEIPLTKLVGYAYVVDFDGILSASDAEKVLSAARAVSPEHARRLLFRGPAVVSEAAAQVFADAGIVLIGVEMQSVGSPQSPIAVHKILLSREVVLLEGVRLADVPAGGCILSAAPLALGGSDGAPVRAYLCTE